MCPLRKSNKFIQQLQPTSFQSGLVIWLHCTDKYSFPEWSIRVLQCLLNQVRHFPYSPNWAPRSMPMVSLSLSLTPAYFQHREDFTECIGAQITIKGIWGKWRKGKELLSCTHMGTHQCRAVFSSSTNPPTLQYAGPVFADTSNTEH